MKLNLCQVYEECLLFTSCLCLHILEIYFCTHPLCIMHSNDQFEKGKKSTEFGGFFKKTSHIEQCFHDPWSVVYENYFQIHWLYTAAYLLLKCLFH